MKLYKLFLIICFLLLVLFQACEEDMHQSINYENEVPLQVTNPNVQNLPGSARISYTLPQDKKGLLYVKAEYEIQPGVTREVKASYYSNSLIVDGFGNTLQCEVNLYSVGRNGKESEPVKVIVNPLTPPLWEAYQSLNVSESWGGISFSFENNSEDNIVFEVIYKDSLGFWVPINNFYTKMKGGRFTVRGFDPEPHLFGISVRDKWLNHTDTLVGEYTPWFEKLLDKSLFKKIELPTDFSTPSGGRALESIWNGPYSPESGWISTSTGGMPQWFTFDLGVMANISRLVVFHRTGNYLFQGACLDKWEIWGSTNPNPDGSFDDSWTLLRECKTFKPSGLPQGESTQEDIEYVLAGEEFVFENVPPVRYLRWKTIRAIDGGLRVTMAKIELYGEVIE